MTGFSAGRNNLHSRYRALLHDPNVKTVHKFKQLRMPFAQFIELTNYNEVEGDINRSGGVLLRHHVSSSSSLYSGSAAKSRRQLHHSLKLKTDNDYSWSVRHIRVEIDRHQERPVRLSKNANYLPSNINMIDNLN